MTTKLKLQITIPVEIEIDALRPEGEFNYVSKCMGHPDNTDNGLSVDENRAWFSKMWRAQVRFQQMLLANPEYLARFMQHLLIDEIVGDDPNTGRRAITPESLEDAIRPVVESLDEAAHFYPNLNKIGLDTYSMVQDVSAAISHTFGEPRVTILEITTDGPDAPPLLAAKH